MSKDYANRKQKTRTSRTQKQVSSLRWTITIAASILFVIALSYLKTHSHKPNKQQQVASHHKVQAKSVVQEANFDFYTILPKMKVSTSESKAQLKPAVVKDVKKNANLKETSYMLQLAAFNKYQEADKFKAEMTLQGFAVKIVSVKGKNNIVFYRVFLGPFANQTLALNMQSQLAKMRLKPLLVKIDREQG